MRLRCALACCLCLMLAAGCGSVKPPSRSQQVDREWIDNTKGTIDQLRRDLVLGASGGDNTAAARAALKNGLYLILVAYTDFGGCGHMINAAGSTPRAFLAVSRTLAKACLLLERASVQFTRAASTNDAALLVAAGRTAARASPLLVRAKTALQAATTSPRSS